MTNLLASVDSERGLIKILIKFPKLIKDISSTIESTDFYITKYQILYSRLLELSEKNIVPDQATIKKIGEDDLEINELFNEDCEVDKLISYSNHILECSEYRSISSLPAKIAGVAEQEDIDVETKKDIISKIVSKVLTKNRTTRDYSMKSAIAETKERLRRAKQGDFGTKTGILELDKAIIGFERGELIVISGRPSSGKSLLTGQMALNMAIQNIGVVFVSYEMSKDQLVLRMLSSLTGINHTALKINNLTKEEEYKKDEMLEYMLTLPMTIMDNSGATFRDIRSTINKLQYKAEAVFIDYLQLMPSVKTNANRAVEIGAISRELKMMAGIDDLNTIVFAMSQMSRSIESRPDGIPRLSDLRESGTIEQDADRVMFIKRGEMNNYMKLYINKQRNLPIFPSGIDVPLNLAIQKVG